MEESVRYWLAGLLEGEGSFVKPCPSSKGQPAISLQMTDEDVIARVSELFNVKYHKVKRRKKHWKDSFLVRKKGSGAIVIMELLKPLMGKRRQQQIEEAINASTVRKKKLVSAKVIDEVWDLNKLGLTQAQIGKKIGFSRETVNRILNKKKNY